MRIREGRSAPYTRKGEDGQQVKQSKVEDEGGPQKGERGEGRMETTSTLLGRRVLGDTLGALRDGVLGQLSGEDEADRCLDLSAGNGRLLVVRRELGCLACNALEDVVDKGAGE